MVNVSWNDAGPSVSGSAKRRARPTDCPRRPSGNMPAVPGRQRGTTAATIPRRWPRSATWPTPRSNWNSLIGRTRPRPATGTCSHRRWGSSSPMLLGCTTCTAMPAVVRIGTGRNTTLRLPRTTQSAQTPEMSVCFVAVPGRQAGLLPFRHSRRDHAGLPVQHHGVPCCQDSVKDMTNGPFHP